jgi:hypothetical protein
MHSSMPHGRWLDATLRFGRVLVLILGGFRGARSLSLSTPRFCVLTSA